MSSDEIKLEDIKEAIKTLFPEGTVVELRVPKAQVKGRSLGTISGYYDNHEELAKDIQSIGSTYTAVYYTLNPCEPSLLSRSYNKAKERAEVTTQDSQIVRRRWLLLDIDPQRAAGTSSSDAEKELAKEKLFEVHEYLKTQGWPRPVFGDSGNGYHALYRIDLENTADNTTLLKNVLASLAAKFDSEKVKVDRSVFNASRIVKAYGSMAKKGEELESQKRFHRLSKLSDTKGGKESVTLDQLQEVAGSAKEPTSTTKPVGGLVVSKSSGSETTPDQVRAFLEFYGFEIKEEGNTNDGRYKFVLTECFFNPDHAAKDAAVLVGPNGIGYRCFHSSCSENTWKVFRAAVEEKFGKKFSFKTLAEAVASASIEDDVVVDESLVLKRHAVLSTINPTGLRKTEWLWNNRVPFGLITIFSGDAGIGKTLMALDLAARLSTGEKFVDGQDNDNDPISTLLLSKEDDADSMIGPRYNVAAGDFKRLFLLEGVTNEKGQVCSVKLDKDLECIREALLADSDIRLVVIDPLMSYLGSKNGYKEQEVRAVLDPLNALAKEFNIAIVIIAHNSKSTGVPNALHKIGGSSSIGEVARLAWMFSANDDKTISTMSQIKYNLGKFTGIDFTTIGEIISGRPELGEQAKIKYLGENNISAEDIVGSREDWGAQKDRREGKKEDYLKSLFKDKPKRYCEEFKDEALKYCGCSWSTLQRIADKIGIYRNGKDTTGPFWTFEE